MKILRFSPTCDLEIDLQIAEGGGASYTIDVRQGPQVESFGPMTTVKAFDTLVEYHSGNTVKVPSKFVIEFAGYAISELKSAASKTVTASNLSPFTYQGISHSVAGCED